MSRQEKLLIPPVFKVLVLGDSAVGKTSLLSRFTVGRKFDITQCQPTVAVEFATRDVEISPYGASIAKPRGPPSVPSTALAMTPPSAPLGHDEKVVVKVQIWDTAGQEKFQALTHMLYRGAHGALVVFDITRRESFEHVSRWINAVRQQQVEGQLPIVIVGNKTDLCHLRAISSAEGEEVARSLGCSYLEASAMEDSITNIAHCFRSVVEQIWQVQYPGALGALDQGPNPDPARTLRPSVGLKADDPQNKPKPRCSKCRNS